MIEEAAKRLAELEPPPEDGPKPRQRPDWLSGGFGVYIHWPYCQAKCPYCDFNSHVRRTIDHSRWRSCLALELREMRKLSGPRQVDTIFFGGGTPSLMSPETVAAVLDEIDQLWSVDPDAEITLEANPTSVEAGAFRSFAAAGVNRVSIGVQALNDADLKALGRLHSADEARAAFEVARSAFDRVSFDLIYARVHQTAAAWEAELRDALAMAVDHLSLYQLTIEPETPFAALHAAGKLTPPSDDVAAEMYALTQTICAEAGLPAYEVSNHARPGAESRHNLVYWRYGDYVGVGPGAHGRITLAEGERIATETVRTPEAWMEQVILRNGGISRREVLPPEIQAQELAMMSLRLREGLDLARYARLADAPIAQDRLKPLLDQSLIELEGDRLRATDAGRMVLNQVIRAVLA